MIIFKKLTYKNFKSVGNNPVEIEFNNGVTLISGTNGTGKSALVSALSFGLFGQDLVLNKPSLINSINQKNLLVTVEFTGSNGKEYIIERGIKPNIFKIYEDKELITEESSTRDYQKVLETQILKMSFKAFKQVIVMGGKSYIPFMKLSAKDRRDFIEDLLDIKIFSSMSVLLKDKIKAVREKQKYSEIELSGIKDKVLMQRNFIKSSKEKQEKRTEEILNSIDKKISDIETLYSENADKIKELASNRKSFHQERYDKLGTAKSGITYKIKSLNENIEVLKTETVCTHCQQEISSETAESHISGHLNEISRLNNVLDKVMTEYLSLDQQYKELKTIELELQGLMSVQKKLLKDKEILVAEKDSILTDDEGVSEHIEKYNELVDKYKEKKESITNLLTSSQYYDMISTIISDDGIKLNIIQKYIPVINSLIAKYLTSMGLWVKFELDSSFTETIKSRYRDTFRYENFSDGQSSRIDLALMMAWADIARMRNAVSTNLSIYDEADAAMDNEGSQMFLELLSLTKDKCNVIISHKGDLLRDKVDNVIEFEIINNFTRIKN